MKDFKLCQADLDAVVAFAAERGIEIREIYVTKETLRNYNALILDKNKVTIVLDAEREPLKTSVEKQKGGVGGINIKTIED